MPGLKEIKIRIKSIGGMRRTTRAMQLVSAAKMRKAQDATLKSRTYASLAWELIENIEAGTKALAATSENMNEEIARSAADEAIPSYDVETASDALAVSGLLKTFPQATKTLVLILSTNRGLVGSLNTNLLNAAQKAISEQLTVNSEQKGSRLATGHWPLATDIITYGKKAREWSVRSHKEVIADFEKFDRSITTEDIYPIAQLITQSYQSGKYKQVIIVYNHFVSTLVQEPRVKQLLPFGPNLSAPRMDSGHLPLKGENAGNIGSTGVISPSGGDVALATERVQQTDYLFEPSPSEVLQHLLPRIIESQIYQTILESEASEQSARMVMMKNATEAAGDLISDLTLTYNKLRQNKITTELAEITAGKIALE